MDITAQYAHHLREEKLQKNSITSYLSDVRQFISWKDQTAPKSVISRELLDQYLQSSSFTRSPHTIRRKRIALNEFLQWINNDGDISVPYSGGRRKVRYVAISLSLILLLVTALSLPSSSSDDINLLGNNTYSSLPDNMENNISANDPIELSVDGIEIAVSGYEISEPIESPSPNNVALSLQSNYKQVERHQALGTLQPTGGNSIIENGSTYTIILDNSITKSSIVTVTPTTPTNGLTMFIQSQGEGYVIVAIEKPTEKPLSFNWIAI